MFRTAFSKDPEEVGPGCYNPNYGDVGTKFMSVAGHQQLKVSP